MKSIVDTLYDAQLGVYDISKVTDTHGAFDIPEAYRLQEELVEKFMTDGRRIIGYKLGLTSREKMMQMGVESPIHGVLFDDMYLEDGAIHYDRLIHPKAEPEVAVKFIEDVLPGASDDELKAAIGFIAPAIDIIDSRFKDFKFTMADVVADNCSAAQFAVGEWIPYNPDETDIDNIKAALYIGDECASEGISSAVLGSPVTALMEFKDSLAGSGIAIKRGQIVLTGAITAASSFNKGDIVTNKTDIGSVSMK